MLPILCLAHLKILGFPPPSQNTSLHHTSVKSGRRKGGSRTPTSLAQAPTHCLCGSRTLLVFSAGLELLGRSHGNVLPSSGPTSDSTFKGKKTHFKSLKSGRLWFETRQKLGTGTQTLVHHVLSSMLHNRQKVETTPLSIERGMDQ